MADITNNELMGKLDALEVKLDTVAVEVAAMLAHYEARERSVNAYRKGVGEASVQGKAMKDQREAEEQAEKDLADQIRQDAADKRAAAKAQRDKESEEHSEKYHAGQREKQARINASREASIAGKGQPRQ